MKVWHIQTWGAGTPHYLVSAETKEDAWKMIEKEWKKKYGNVPSKVGGRAFDFFGDRKYTHQTIDYLIEIKGLTTKTSLIVDLDENIL